MTTKTPSIHDLVVDLEHHAMHVQKLADEKRWPEFIHARSKLTLARRRLVRAVAANAGAGE